MTEITNTAKTTATIPVSLEVGLANDFTKLENLLKIIFNAFFGLVRRDTKREFIVLSSKMFQTGFEVLSAKLTATDATIIPPPMSRIQCIPR